MTEQAYPLSWPHGWPRTPSYKIGRSRFGERTLATAVEMLLAECDRLYATEVVISSNVTLTTYGRPKSGSGEPSDRGVAVYFKLKGKPRVLACDKWDRVADNLAAIAKHIDALRGQERWGVGSVEQAFAGYTPLPPPSAFDWKAVLGVTGTSLEAAEMQYRFLAKQHHPDNGGDAGKMAELNRAIDEARKELS